MHEEAEEKLAQFTGGGGAEALGKLKSFGDDRFPFSDVTVRQDAAVDKPMLIEQDIAQVFGDHSLNLGRSDVPAAAGRLRAAPRTWARISWLQSVVPIASERVRAHGLRAHSGHVAPSVPPHGRAVARRQTGVNALLPGHLDQFGTTAHSESGLRGTSPRMTG